MANRKKVLQDHQIDTLLNEMFTSEEENDADEDLTLDYVPKSFNERLNEIQGMSNRQLLHILEDDARQFYQESCDEEIPPCIPLSDPSFDLPEVLAPAFDEDMTPCVPLSAPFPDLPAHPEVLAPAVREEIAPRVRLSAPFPNLPAHLEVLAPAVREEIAPRVRLSAPFPNLPDHLEVLAPAVREEIAPCVRLSAPFPNLPAHPEVLTPAVDEETVSCILLPASSSGLPANMPTYAELQARNRAWTTHVENFEELNSSKEIEPTKSYSHQSLPIEYFSNLFPNEIFEMIVEYTNKYARIKQSKFWRDTNVNEIKAFLAIIILMGINPQSDIELYWSADPFYNNIEISSTMTCKRFKKILENLYVCDITTHLPRNHKDHDKLQKVRPLLDYLNRTFQENATNSGSQSVDESMIKFKGRDSKKQYMPAKPIKRGFKAWCRCDSKTGYLYQCDIYTGKDQEFNEEGLGYRVVMKLGGSLPRNTHLIFDNFFSSLALMEALFHRGILATGTVRMNRKGLPKELCTSKPTTPDERRLAKENKLSSGEFTYRFCHPCAVIKWQDTKEVFVLSTAVNPTKVEVIQRTQKNGRKKDMYCPSAIAEYTRSMGGVDHFDHYRSSYSIGRRSKKSWFRIFWFLFESAIINAYILYKHKNQNRKTYIAILDYG